VESVSLTWGPRAGRAQGRAFSGEAALRSCGFQKADPMCWHGMRSG
jgi:hypothetical protein